MAGVGTELAALIPTWAARQTAGCGCNDMKKKLDSKGVEWAKDNKAQIIGHLLGQRSSLTRALRIMPFPALHLAATKLVDTAIARAEGKETDLT